MYEHSILLEVADSASLCIFYPSFPPYMEPSPSTMSLPMYDDVLSLILSCSSINSNSQIFMNLYENMEAAPSG
jgi:hypothetical protein